MLQTFLTGQIVYWVLETPNIILVGGRNIALFLVLTFAAMVIAVYASVKAT